MSKEKVLKQQILELTKEYYEIKFNNDESYVEGNRVNYAGRVFDSNELINLVDSSLNFWLTAGDYADKFEKELAEYLGLKYCSLVNSGSSANLLAFMALTSYKLGERRIKKGDEVITVAAGFPTTIAPIIQYGAIPVFVDVTIPQYNIDCDLLEGSISDKTKAVMIAHTLGNPFDLLTVREFCDRHGLWLIEDNCDALGSEYFYKGEWKKTGTIGDIGTSSFYPPHHITMGEGGAVYTNNLLLYHIVNSFRDWGRDCFCAPGTDGSCKNRYTQQFGELPEGYDHKYVYSHFGYNLKATEMQAAIGCAQLKKLDDFTIARQENWNYIKINLESVSQFIELPISIANSNPSWFGFLMTVRKDAGFTRDELVSYLENKNIQTRNLFAGNIIKHPCFDEMRESKVGYRQVGELKNTDIIMKQSFWIGVYPGMSEDKLAYMVKIIKNYILELSNKIKEKQVEN